MYLWLIMKKITGPRLVFAGWILLVLWIVLFVVEFVFADRIFARWTPKEVRDFTSYETFAFFCLIASCFIAGVILKRRRDKP